MTKYKGLEEVDNNRIDIDWDDLPADDFLVNITSNKYAPMSGKSAKSGVGKRMLFGNSILRNLFGGIIGAYIAYQVKKWLQIEIGWFVNSYANTLAFAAVGDIVSSIFICGTIVILDAMTERNFLKLINRLARTTAFAVIVAAIGGVLTQLLYNVLGGGDSNTLHFSQIFARTAAWAATGIFLGIVLGLSGGKRQQIVNGLIGGFLGGFIGGSLFDLLITSQSYSTGKIVLEMSMGGCIGLAVGLVETVRKDAWLEVLSGKLSGKQFIVFDNITTIGASPSCDITLFADPLIAAEHCRIIHIRGRNRIECADGCSVRINGKMASNDVLRPGNQVEVGATTMIFNERNKK